MIDESGVPFIFLSQFNRWLQYKARFTSSGQYIRAVAELQVRTRQIVGFFDRYDVLLIPTYLHPVIRIGEWARLRPAKMLEKIINWVHLAHLLTLQGNPRYLFPRDLCLMVCRWACS